MDIKILRYSINLCRYTINTLQNSPVRFKKLMSIFPVINKDEGILTRKVCRIAGCNNFILYLFIKEEYIKEFKLIVEDCKKHHPTQIVGYIEDCFKEQKTQ